MIRDILQQNENVHANDNQIAVLREHFPACFKQDGSFDLERFKEAIADKTNVVQEGYELKFLGKSYAKLLASTDTTTVIQPDETHNNLPENANSENIYISGDNLDGLKHLLKSYQRSIKCIYIDPPYNTGSDGFVYQDNFNYTKETLQEKLSVSDEEAQHILDLTKRGSASHSAWLMFMSSRLLLAGDLLTDDGVVFISIDDNEQANLKLLCDDVFGEDCFIGCIPRVTKRSGKSSDSIALNHDYVFVYSKTLSPKFYPLSHNDSGFKHKDDFFEDRGYYKLNQTLDYDSLQYSKSLDYPIEIDGETFYPGTSYEDYLDRQNGNYDRADWAWRWSKEKFKFGYDNGFVVIKRSRNGVRIYTKTYLKASIEDDGNNYVVEYSERTKGLSTLEFTDNIYSNDNATKDIGKTIGKKVFDHTKPIALMSTILDLTVKQNDIVLDFFSGSATLAEGVFWYNAHNEQNIRFILVQLQEEIKVGTKAYSQNYRTIDQIGIDRIKKSAALVKGETGSNMDCGFKHYVLVEPNQNTLDRLESFDKASLMADTTILDDFGKPTILATWLNADGYGLTTQAAAVDLAGYTAYYYNKHLYLMDGNFSLESMKALLLKYDAEGQFNPENLVLFGYSFPDWSINEMIEKNLRILNDGEKNLKINFSVRY
jgi:adenine-specific DNA-methyltransferase